MSTIAQVAAAALTVRGVTAGYGKTTVLRSIDLALRPGQVTALLGPNGAGKTTLIRTIAGELPLSAGSVLIGDADVTRLSPERRVRLGACTIPEGHGIFRSLSVRQNLVLHTVSASRADAIEMALTAFPALRDRLTQRAGTMSGGQQKQLALARCVTSNPAVILLDEVSMGLSPRVLDDIYAAISRLAETGVALLLVEQYVARALAMADSVAVLDRGEISFNGSTADIDADELSRRYLSR